MLEDIESDDGVEALSMRSGAVVELVLDVRREETVRPALTRSHGNG